ncbi:N/A [soil metagenome]
MQPTREFSLPPNKVAASVRTDPGCVRETNEDNGRHVSPFAADNDRGSLTIVADGMGGHSSGEVASEMAVDLISRYYYGDRDSHLPDALRLAVEQANADIYDASTADEKFLGMGTTVVVLVIRDGIGYSAHVGDSRLYRMRGGVMERLTVDHSQVMEMVELGIISMEEAQHHEDKNVILRAVGTQPTVEVEVSEPFSIEAGDEFMLCSDGLSDMADDEDIRQVWAGAPDVHEAAERLVELARVNGGGDNITVGIVRATVHDETHAAKSIPVTREIGVS